MIEYRGRRLHIRCCEQPPAGEEFPEWEPPSWREALHHIDKNQHDSIRASMIARYRQLADVGALRSPNYWNKEAKLPDGKNFFAIKVKKIRAYGWFSN